MSYNFKIGDQGSNKEKLLLKLNTYQFFLVCILPLSFLYMVWDTVFMALACKRVSPDFRSLRAAILNLLGIHKHRKRNLEGTDAFGYVWGLFPCQI